MGFLGMLALVMLAVFVILIYFFVTGIKQKSWKRIVFPLLGFVTFVAVVYLGLMFFVTSM